VPIPRTTGFAESDGERISWEAMGAGEPALVLCHGAGGNLHGALFVAGAEDALFPPAAIRASAAKVPGARVVEIADAGHSPYFEQPEAWNRAVAEFLGSELD
jgi:pimeloyl-ACP methyl ester carboxylesterase